MTFPLKPLCPLRTFPHSRGSHEGGQSKRLQACTGAGLAGGQSSSRAALVRLLPRAGRWVQATVRVFKPTPHVAEQELHPPVCHLGGAGGLVFSLTYTFILHSGYLSEALIH